jgi:putative flippase GtrA
MCSTERRVTIFVEHEPQKLLGQFFSFSSVGVFGTALHYAILIALVDFAKLNPLVASGTGAAAGALFNYFMNYTFAFKSRRKHRVAMPRFFAVVVSGLALNTAIMAIGIEALHLHYLYSQILATVLVLFWNFGGSKLWAF